MNPVNHVKRAEAATKTLLNALDEMHNVAREYAQGGAGPLVTEQAMIDAFGSHTEGEGELAVEVPNVTVAQYVAAITTFDAFITLQAQGHGTNLYNFRQ
jgi:2,4-dienoyl-CoA reductase-like NADH-dependent reductase (Old Yellow Enzyme family)